MPWTYDTSTLVYIEWNIDTSATPRVPLITLASSVDTAAGKVAMGRDEHVEQTTHGLTSLY